MKDLLAQIKDEKGKTKDKYEGYERVYLYMKMFYGFFICWVGFNLLLSEPLNETEKKYMKQSLTLIKNMTNYFYPDLFKDRKYTLEDVVKKTPEIVNTLCYMFIIGGLLTAIGYKLGKYIVVISLFLDILFVKNFFYLKGEKLRVNVFKFIAFLGGAFYIQ